MEGTFSVKKLSFAHENICFILQYVNLKVIIHFKQKTEKTRNTIKMCIYFHLFSLSACGILMHDSVTHQCRPATHLNLERKIQRLILKKILYTVRRKWDAT